MSVRLGRRKIVKFFYCEEVDKMSSKRFINIFLDLKIAFHQFDSLSDSRENALRHSI